MKYYAVAEVNVTNLHWVGSYLAHVTQVVERHGGKYLARTSSIDQVEGTGSVHQTAVILEFPSREAAYGFYNSPKYTPLREARKAGFFGKLYFVAGEDSARPK